MKTQLLIHPQFGEVRTVGVKGETWFVAKDVCDILNIKNNRDAISRLDDDETLDGVGITDAIGRTQNMTLVNESGIYSLIFQSRNNEAKLFRKWATSEVLPAIRQYGFYIHPSLKPSNGEIRKIERVMRTNVQKYITEEDIWNCHKKLRVDEMYVRRVLSGSSANNTIMNDLQERAMANHQRWVDSYSTGRMTEVINTLSNK